MNDFQSIKVETRTYEEILKVPVLVMIQLPVDYFPTHGFLDDVKVIWHVLFRDRVFEVVMAVKSINTPTLMGSQKLGENAYTISFSNTCLNGM